MGVLKLADYKDLLMCNHDDVVVLSLTDKRFTKIQEDLRVVTDTDLRDRVTISDCTERPQQCLTIAPIAVGLAKDIALNDGTIPVLRNMETVTVQHGIVT